MFKKVWFYITVLWDMAREWVDSYNDYSTHPFTEIILTDGTLDGDIKSWNCLPVKVIGGRYYYVFERVRHGIKEVRWFECVDGDLESVPRSEVGPLLSIRSGHQ